jgi:hypothetical protein
MCNYKDEKNQIITTNCWLTMVIFDLCIYKKILIFELYTISIG